MKIARPTNPNGAFQVEKLMATFHTPKMSYAKIPNRLNIKSTSDRNKPMTTKPELYSAVPDTETLSANETKSLALHPTGIANPR